jgi:hypothetical protein
MKPLVTEHEHEPVPGLPGELPQGEQLVWQGAPRWTALAVHAFHVRALTAYFVVLLGARAAWLAGTGLPVSRVVLGCVGPALVAAVAIGILAGLAWLAARSTLYSVTNRRVVIRAGIALPVTVNLPFRGIEGASIKVRSNGSGDIALAMARSQRVGYAVLWPHVRPWKLTRPEPMLRAIPDAAEVGELLSRHYASAVQAGETVQSNPVREPAPRASVPATPAAA